MIVKPEIYRENERGLVEDNNWGLKVRGIPGCVYHLTVVMPSPLVFIHFIWERDIYGMSLSTKNKQNQNKQTNKKLNPQTPFFE